MNGIITTVTGWFLSLFKSVFLGLVDFFHDVSLWIFSGILDAIAGGILLIPVPDFFSSGLNVGSLYSAFPPFALYVISKLHLVEAFSILSAGVAFRLGRKLFTLGQW